MLRNYLIAALHNLTRNRLYTTINIAGLAIGFAAAMLIGLYVRSEFSFENFIEDHRSIYHVTSNNQVPGQASKQTDRVPPGFAALLEEDSESIQAITRLFLPGFGPQAVLRKGNIESREELLWADPNVFAVLPFRPVAGEPRDALLAPDGVVLTRSLALKYFGREDPVGEIIELDREYPLRVTAVVEDIPSESHFNFSALVSGLSSVSPQSEFETTLASNARNYDAAYTYLRLAPGVPANTLETALSNAAARPEAIPSAPLVKTYNAEPIAAINLRPANPDAMKASNGRQTVLAISIVGALIVAVVGINFINLTTTRLVRRAIETGVRKVHGAARLDLIVQFVGEALIYVGIGTLAALLLCALSLPTFNALTDRTITMRFSGAEIISITAAAIAFSIIAGFYPAFVLSSFHPSRVFSSGRSKLLRTGQAHRVLVAFQFSVFVGLILSGGVIWRQTAYGMKEGLRLDSEAMLVVNAGGCAPRFVEAVRGLPGVRGAVCSIGAPLEWFRGVNASRAGGTEIILGLPSIDFGLLELYGLQPVAGRFFDSARTADMVPRDAPPAFTTNIVINETAARELGFSSPEEALGQSIFAGPKREPAQIIGVAPDYRLASDSVRSASPPIAFVVDPKQIERFASVSQLHIKLDGRALPESLESIDSLWKSLGPARLISRFFVDRKIQESFASVVRQAQVLGGFSGVALLVACLGLFGLSASSAEERTKEIGIRKTLGASKHEIITMLLWEFSKPVLWANLIAWPIAYLTMSRWLDGFAYHIDLEFWMFLGASGIAFTIALITVIGHALMIARAQPVTALRHE